MSAIPTCPTDCSTILPDIEFDACNPKVFFGEIHKIYVAAIGAADFTDVTDVSEWTARLAGSGGDIDSIRELVVSADLPAPDQNVIEISNKRKVTTPSTFTIAVDIDEISNNNYEFMRITHCNQRYKIWYETDDHIFGGNTGIPSNIMLNHIIERGTKSLHKLTGSVSWDATYPAVRNDSPFAA